MKAYPIAAARQIGKAVGAQRVVVITIDGPHFGITTWGGTTRDCRDLARWAESEAATEVVRAIAGVRVESSCVSVACIPGVSDDDEHAERPRPDRLPQAGEGTRSDA